MPNTNRYYLTGLLLDFWRKSDLTKQTTNIQLYREYTVSTIQAAKRVNHEALSRFLRAPYSIPYPWEGAGGLDQ